MEKWRNTSIPARIAFGAGGIRFLEIQPGKGDGGAVWVAHLENERHVLEGLPTRMPGLEWNELEMRRRPQISGIVSMARLYMPNRRRILRLAKLLYCRGLKVFEVMRVIDLIGYYAHYLEIFKKGSYSLAVMSSHSNPHGIAFNLAARKFKIPVVLITHGMPIKPLANLAFDLAVVHCEAAKKLYADEGCRIAEAFCHGRKQDYSQIRNEPYTKPVSVGIFLCKDVNEEVFRSVTETLLQNPKVSNILVRPHPKNLWFGLDKWIEDKADARLKRSRSDRSDADIESVDIVLGGNSSVLIEAVTGGRPAVYVPGLDYGSSDLHGFVAGGLVGRFEGETFDPNKIWAFHHQAGWQTIYESYANIHEDNEDVMTRAAAAMSRLSGSARSILPVEIVDPEPTISST